jgi:hypothetical protein
MNRLKRNLPNVPTTLVQLRRANSESRFTLPAVPHQTVDDECDLLEIDINDPIGSMNKTLRSKTESELVNTTENGLYQTCFNTTNASSSADELLISSKKRVKQLRDQTTNTPPISTLNSSIKSKKKLKKKSSSQLNNPTDQNTPPVTPPTTKLQKVYIYPLKHLYD